MKKCFSIIFVLNLLMIASVQASAEGIASKSRALFEVISMIEAARYDLPVSYEVRDIEIITDDQVCENVVAQDVVDAFVVMLEAYQEVFPDDELPYEEATSDFSNLVGSSDYVRCESVDDQDLEILKIVTFTSPSNSFQVTFLHHQLK
jgi:hypothetical protein